MLLATEPEGSEVMRRTLEALWQWAGVLASRLTMARVMVLLALISTVAAVLVVPEARELLGLDENPPDGRQGKVKPNITERESPPAGGPGGEEPNVPEGEGRARLGAILKSHPKEEGAVFVTGPSHGVVVIEVSQGGPADRAGLQRNDVIVAVDSTDVSHIVDFTRTIDTYAPGDVVTLTVYRPNGFGPKEAPATRPATPYKEVQVTLKG
jgi:hypothetical protein